MTVSIILLLLGFALLVMGGELLVRGAVRFAEHFRLSPMLIGLTVVGMGTSMPELAASVQAALSGSPGIALGNIVGSNLVNILLILGAGALIAPAIVARGVLWRDGLLGLAGVLALLAVGHLSGLDRLAGAVFISVLIAYIAYAYRQERQLVATATATATATETVTVTAAASTASTAAGQHTAVVMQGDPGLAPQDPPRAGIGWAALLFLIGLALIVTGGIVLVDAAVAIASRLGVSDTVIGLTIVAAGTSFPELVTTVIASIRRQSDIALGNVLGSNIYNVFFIGGVTGMVAPGPIPTSILTGDLYVLLAATLAAMIFAFTGGRLGRREGLALVLAYVAYLGWTVTAAT